MGKQSKVYVVICYLLHEVVGLEMAAWKRNVLGVIEPLSLAAGSLPAPCKFEVLKQLPDLQLVGTSNLADFGFQLNHLFDTQGYRNIDVTVACAPKHCPDDGSSPRPRTYTPMKIAHGVYGLKMLCTNEFEYSVKGELRKSEVSHRRRYVCASYR